MKKKLTWFYERMLHKHSENENIDYMMEFKEIIDSLPKFEIGDRVVLPHVLAKNIPSTITRLSYHKSEHGYSCTYSVLVDEIPEMSKENNALDMRQYSAVKEHNIILLSEYQKQK